MKTLNFNNYSDLIAEINEKYDAITKVDDLDDVAIIAKYDEMRIIFQHLAKHSYEIAFVQLYYPDWDGYNDEFILQLSEGSIWVEPMKRDGKYLFVESTAAYILGNCSAKLLADVDSRVIYEVNIGADVVTTEDVKDNCSCDLCCKCNYANIPDKERETSINMKSEYKVNGKNVDKETFNKEWNEALASVLPFWSLF